MTWWITDTSIGQRLKFVRRFRRLTQKELGLLMGYSEKTADVRIAQYEKNARTPNAETTAKLAEVLKVSPVVFSPTICASREDLLQSMYWLFLMKGGGDIHVLPDAGRYAIQRAGGRERNPVCLLPCHSHCRSPVPQPHDGQAFFE